MRGEQGVGAAVLDDRDVAMPCRRRPWPPGTCAAHVPLAADALVAIGRNARRQMSMATERKGEDA